MKFEKIVDEIIALTVVGATTAFVGLGINVPDWWSTAFGVIIAYYYTRKTVKEQREQQAGR